jgi:hypothetical protein
MTPGCGKSPGTPSSAIQLPQVLLARIMASATIRSSGAPRWRVLICTCSVPSGSAPSLPTSRKL